MPMTDTMQNALEAYEKGTSLMQRERYKEAVPYLNRAVDLYRAHDAEGHPAELVLKNGVSALANTLYHLGICSEQTGDLSRAIICFETANINERFEHTAPFRTFSRNLTTHLIACYERQLAAFTPGDIDSLLSGNAATDSTYLFPYSLDQKIIPCARLYELAPQRYERFRLFYLNAKKQDSLLRRTGSKTDDQSMRRISVGVWSVIAAIWVVYGIVVLRALLLDR